MNIIQKFNTSREQQQIQGKIKLLWFLWDEKVFLRFVLSPEQGWWTVQGLSCLTIFLQMQEWEKTSKWSFSLKFSHTCYSKCKNSFSSELFSSWTLKSTWGNVSQRPDSIEGKINKCPALCVLDKYTIILSAGAGNSSAWRSLWCLRLWWHQTNFFCLRRW